MKDAYQLITNRIIELMEQGVVPWHKPWRTKDGQVQRNLVSKKPYHGINVMLLGCAGYRSPWWVSFKQAKELGGNVRKGEKGNLVCFWKWLEVAEEGKDGQKESKTIPFLRHYYVFNVEQCEGLEGKIPAYDGGTDAERDHRPIKIAERILAGMPDNKPRVDHGFGQACYRPATDTVCMPDRGDFDTAEHYYDTLFHELTHSTGHPSRLAREGITEPVRFGSKTYAREELVAEMGAAFLCGECGIVDRIIDNSAAYVQSWLQKLKNDKRLVIVAAGQAQKAAGWILGNGKEEA